MRGSIARLRSFASELRRRNVFKVASVYAVTAWGTIMGASQLFPVFGAPGWTVRMFVVIAVLGFPIAIALAWAYELRPTPPLQGASPVEPGEALPALAAPGAAAALPRAAGDETRFVSTSTVHVRWEDVRGRHERSFAHDFQVGRDAACDVHLDDPMTSRRHASVEYREGLWWVRDLGSRNGTLVDGRRVTQVPLPSQCELRLHDEGVPLRMEIVGRPDARTVTSSRIHLTNE
jgi:hypothetical protein